MAQTAAHLVDHVIAAIREQPVIEKILTHLGLQARASPRAPARRSQQQAARAFKPSHDGSSTTPSGSSWPHAGGALANTPPG